MGLVTAAAEEIDEVVQLGVLNRPIVKQDELWFYYVGAKSRTPPYLLWPDGKPRKGKPSPPPVPRHNHWS